ncbi:MAG: putative manganese transporter [Syntrophobacteria bacterium]
MEIAAVFKDAVMITVFVFVMMLLVDFIETATNSRMSAIMRGGRWRQYSLASFLGSTPGCLGAFMNVSLYVHGVITFGALVGGMIATSGDEAFVMLSQFPGTALALFGMLFVAGIFFAWLSDKIIQVLGIIPCESCAMAQCDHCLLETDNSDKPGTIADIFTPKNFWAHLQSLSFTRFLLLVLIGSFLLVVCLGILGPSSWNWKRLTFVCLSFCSLYIALVASEHYLHGHIWDHIIKRHLFRVFLWSFGALLFVHCGLAFWNLDAFVRQHLMWVLVLGALIGIIPESGPHLVFVMMYAQGMIPFSVLFTTSFVQDGHGMIPLLSYSIKDSLLVKMFNLFFGLAVGGFLFALGL